MLTINFDTYEYFYNHVELSIKCKVTKKKMKKLKSLQRKINFSLVILFILVRITSN